jgi:beta-glucosidase
MVDGTTAAMAPSAVSLASTWDTEITKELGSLLATEMRDKKADILLAPTGASDPHLQRFPNDIVIHC